LWRVFWHWKFSLWRLQVFKNIKNIPLKFAKKDNLWVNISRERFDAADGDVIFVWGLGNDAETAYKRLQDDPLWSQLGAVQAGKVYPVPGYWIGRGPIAANKVLEDLSTYLLEEEN